MQGSQRRKVRLRRARIGDALEIGVEVQVNSVFFHKYLNLQHNRSKVFFDFAPTPSPRGNRAVKKKGIGYYALVFRNEDKSGLAL